jgi:outer membrane protein assembly factor BamD
MILSTQGRRTLETAPHNTLDLERGHASATTAAWQEKRKRRAKFLDTPEDRWYDAGRLRGRQEGSFAVVTRFTSTFRFTMCFVAALAALGTACAAKQGKKGVLDYSRSAKDLFDNAMEQFDDEDCTEAEKLFEDVRRQFPYSKYAVEAELKIADCKFSDGADAEAAVAYQQFVKAHPTHEAADYAAFKRGMAFVEQIPGDFFIMPPSYERDQSATRDAREAFASFLRTYPDSRFRERASEELVQVVDALVRHEMYVARFYLSRDLRKAASVRLEGIWVSFPESTLVPDAMFLQATTFLEMGEPGEARRIFMEIARHYPEHYQTKRAKDYLRHLEVRGAQGD